MAGPLATFLLRGRFEGQVFDDIFVVALQLGKQAFVAQIERTRVLPVKPEHIMDAVDDVPVPNLNGQLATAVKAARRKIDRANDRALSIGEEHLRVKLHMLEFVNLDADIAENAKAADSLYQLVLLQFVGGRAMTCT